MTAKLVVVPLVRARVRAVTRPVLLIEKRVEVAKLEVEEEMEKSEEPVYVEEAAKRERSEYGVVVPRPSMPLAVKVLVAV